MWLTRLAISRRVTICMFIGILIVLGIVGLSRMPWDLFPRIDVPVVTVIVPYPGAGPEEIEQRIIRPLEDATSVIENVDHVTGVAQENVGSVTLQFTYDVDTDVAAANVRDAVARVKGQFPEDAQEPSVLKLDIGAAPVFTLGVTGERLPRDLRQLVEDEIKPRFGQAAGVAAVTLTGGEQREIQVLARKERLEAVGLSISQLSASLQTENLDLPSGSIREGTRDYRVRVLGQVKHLDEIRALRLRTPRGGLLRLDQIAEVEDTVVEPTELARINGVPSVGVRVMKQSDANTVQVCRGIRRAMDELGKRLPKDIKFTVAQDNSEQVIEAILDVRNALVYGALFAALVVFLFLHNFRGTIIVALAIPTSLLATFLPIGIGFGFTLNMMVMLALALVVGVLVDDSVVVLENIQRHLDMGELPEAAAVNGRSEIGAAAVAITMVDVVVFLPVAMMEGVVGQIFFSFGITVVVCVMFSLLMSFTLTPMFAAWWYQRKSREAPDHRGLQAFWAAFFAVWDAGYGQLERIYRGMLRRAIAHPYVTILIAYGALAVTIRFLAPMVSFEFFPSSDERMVSIALETPVGTRLEETDRVMGIIEKRLQDSGRYPELANLFVEVGSAGASMMGAGDVGPSYGSLSLALHPVKERKKAGQRSDRELAADLRHDLRDIPGTKLTITTGGGGGPGGDDVDLRLVGEDPPELDRKAELARRKVAQIEGLVDVNISAESGRPEIQVVVDRQRLADFGLPLAHVAMAVRTSIAGSTDSKYRVGGDEYDIRVQLQEADRNTTEDIAATFVGLGRGDSPVYVRDVADVFMGAGPTRIERYERQRAISLTATAVGMGGQDALRAVEDALAKTDLGGVSWSWGGSTQMQKEAFGSIIQALVLAMALVYMLAAALYNSVLEPFNILMIFPLALVGAVVGLVVTGNSVSIVALIGVIMLTGIVGKNSILVVDYTNTLRARGLDRRAALLEAGPTRMKPILMTTLAASMGMLPTALALAEGSEWRAPMAVVVIFGLIISTALSLLVVPASYCIWDQVGSFFTGLGRRLFVRAHSAEDDQV